MFETYDDILSAGDVAEILHVGLNTVYLLIKEGKLKAFRTGSRSWRIPKTALMDYVSCYVYS